MLKHTLIALAALLAANPAFSADTPSPATQLAAQEVRYDAATDRLSLNVQNLSLTEVLARISRQSDVEILMDPSVERPVTASLQDQPLESVLGNLTRGMNAVMIHDERDLPGQGRQPVLVRLELLPTGETNTALLRPVLSPEAEALLRAKGHDPADPLVKTRVNARRQARLEKMDPAQRERIEAQDAAKASRKAESKAARLESQAKRHQARLERLNAKLTRAQALAATDPEAGQQRVQRLNQRIARLQQGKTPSAGSATP
jgi:hypothetical protein